jgi:hypothetical protein
VSILCAAGIGYASKPASWIFLAIKRVAVSRLVFTELKSPLYAKMTAGSWWWDNASIMLSIKRMPIEMALGKRAIDSPP